MNHIEKAKHWLIHKLGGYTYVERFEQKVVAVPTTTVKIMAEQLVCGSNVPMSNEWESMAKERVSQKLADKMLEETLITFETHKEGWKTKIRGTVMVAKEDA